MSDWREGNEAPGYDEFINGLGYQVDDITWFGSYQGDIAAVLRDGDRWGWLLLGYGSCSVCDWLEGEFSGTRYSEPATWLPIAERISDEIDRMVRWGTASELADYLTSPEYEGEWHFHDREISYYRLQLVERLRGVSCV